MICSLEIIAIIAYVYYHFINTMRISDYLNKFVGMSYLMTFKIFDDILKLVLFLIV